MNKHVNEVRKATGILNYTINEKERKHKDSTGKNKCISVRNVSVTSWCSANLILRLRRVLTPT